MAKGLSRREYATRRGVSEKAVRKALKDRIAAALLPDDTIDADLADRLWEENTRVSQRRGVEALRAKASIAAAIEERSAPGADPADREPGIGSAPAETGSAPEPIAPAAAPVADNVVPLRGRLEEHRQANLAKRQPASRPEGPQPGTLVGIAVEIEEERLRRLRRENDIAEGKLVDQAKTTAHFFTVLRASTSSWQVFPTKAGPKIAARFDLPNAHEVSQFVAELVRQELMNQSKSQEDIDAANRS
jgi:hypothetical protein